ncbi:UTRA domain-containing protein [Actinotignum sp. GS-2025e]|uniref:UTRA domain-containing protein n=1 Tax=Actinotignum sp. GS-2025e TaxID=3427278 RepID=UPI003F46422D
MENGLGIALSHGSRTISAVGADRNLARILAVPHGFPLIDMKQVTYDASDRPVETSRIWIRPDRLRIHSIVHRTPLPS